MVEGLYYPYSENKGADQLRGYREADLRLCLRICKKPVFSRRSSNLYIYALMLLCVITKTRPCRYTEIFHGCKNVNFQMKFFNIFLIFAQNIDCGYTLEPPQ